MWPEPEPEPRRDEMKTVAAPLKQEQANNIDKVFRHDRNYIYINDAQIKKDDFIYAFGESMAPPQTQPTTMRLFGNPAPAGLCSFGMVCVTLGMINMGAKDISDASILIGSCFFSTGIVELICAIWSIVLNKTFAATVFFCFFGFWCSFGMILGNAFGIQDAYDTATDYNNALGLFLMPYTIFTFMIWLCTLKSTWPFTVMFFCIWFFVVLIDIGYFTQSSVVTSVGGFFCIVSGLLGLYNGFTCLAEKDNCYFHFNPMFMPGAFRRERKEGSDIEKNTQFANQTTII